MNYYKHDGLVVIASNPPMILAHGAGALVGENSQSYLYSYLTPWVEATEVEYRLYKAKANPVLMSRNAQAGMWVLNEGNDQALRIGSNWPQDGKSVDFMTGKDAKIALIRNTQHWYNDTRPKTQKTNSDWSKWIKRMRRVEPFIYLGAA